MPSLSRSPPCLLDVLDTPPYAATFPIAPASPTTHAQTHAMVKIGPRITLRRRSTPKPEPAPPEDKFALLIGANYSSAPRDSEYPPLRRAREDTKEFRKLLIGASLSLSLKGCWGHALCLHPHSPIAQRSMGTSRRTSP